MTIRMRETFSRNAKQIHLSKYTFILTWRSLRFITKILGLRFTLRARPCVGVCVLCMSFSYTHFVTSIYQSVRMAVL